MGMKLTTHLQRETRLWMSGTVSLSHPHTPSRPGKGQLRHIISFLNEFLPVRRRQYFSLSQKCCLVNISVISRHFHHKWFRDRISKNRAGYVTQPRNQFLRDGFSVNIRESGGNAGHSPSKYNTRSFNQDTLSYRDCQK